MSEYEFEDAESIEFNKDTDMFIVVLPKSILSGDRSSISNNTTYAIRVPKDKVLQILEVEPMEELKHINEVICLLQKLRETKVLDMVAFKNFIESLAKQTDDIGKLIMEDKIEPAKANLMLRVTKNQKDIIREARFAIKYLSIHEGELRAKRAELQRIYEG